MKPGENKSYVFGSTFTVGWLEKTIKNRLGKNEQKSLHIAVWESSEENTGKAEGQGYLSKPAKVKVEWEGEGAEEMPTAFFFKIPTPDNIERLDEELKSKIVSEEERRNRSKFESPLCDMHNMECKAYQLWMENEAPSDLIPVCFHTCPFNPRGEQPLLLLQDLSRDGFVPPFSHELGLQEAFQIAEFLGKLHAWSLDHQHLIKDFVLTDKLLYLRAIHIDLLREWSSKYPEYFDKAKVERVVSTMTDEAFVCQNHISRRRTSISPVLVHGDLWCNNLFLRNATNANGENQVLAVLDWQMVHFGSPAEDFACLLFGSGSPELRRQEFVNKVLPHYFSVLRLSLGKEPPFDEKEFLVDWEEMHQPGWSVFMGFTSLGMMTKLVEVPGLERLLLRGKALLQDVTLLWDGDTIF